MAVAHRFPCRIAAERESGFRGEDTGKRRFLLIHFEARLRNIGRFRCRRLHHVVRGAEGVSHLFACGSKLLTVVPIDFGKHSGPHRGSRRILYHLDRGFRVPGGDFLQVLSELRRDFDRCPVAFALINEIHAHRADVAPGLSAASEHGGEVGDTRHPGPGENVRYLRNLLHNRLSIPHRAVRHFKRRAVREFERNVKGVLVVLRKEPGLNAKE